MENEEDEFTPLIERAKQKWLKDNPSATEFQWELISDFERDSYVFKEFRNAGYEQYEYMGKPAFIK